MVLHKDLRRGIEAQVGNIAVGSYGGNVHHSPLLLLYHGRHHELHHASHRPHVHVHVPLDIIPGTLPKRHGGSQHHPHVVDQDGNVLLLQMRGDLIINVLILEVYLDYLGLDLMFSFNFLGHSLQLLHGPRDEDQFEAVSGQLVTTAHSPPYLSAKFLFHNLDQIIARKPTHISHTVTTTILLTNSKPITAQMSSNF